ncbi:MAG: hypothetical protein J6S69_10525, partial [Proteobacteria bacterium]|nr:hypothetical protein [Pseudomonadota bacterium]
MASRKLQKGQKKSTQRCFLIKNLIKIKLPEQQERLPEQQERLPEQQERLPEQQERLPEQQERLPE